MKYGYKKQANDKWMVIKNEYGCMCGLGYGSYNLTKEEAVKLANIYADGNAREF